MVPTVEVDGTMKIPRLPARNDNGMRACGLRGRRSASLRLG